MGNPLKNHGSTRWNTAETGLLTLLVATACGAPDGAGNDPENLGTATQAVWNGSNDCDPDPADPTECVEGSLGVSEEQRARNGVVRVKTSEGSCSGTLLTPQLVLTAAHCVDEYVSGDTIEIMVNHRRDPSYQFVEASPPPYVAAVSSSRPFLVRGNAPYTDGTTDLSLIFLDEPTTTIVKIMEEFGGPPYTEAQILEFGYPVQLRKQAMVSVQENVQFVGFGTSDRPDLFTAVSPIYRQTSGLLTFPFSRENAPTFPQKLIKSTYDFDNYLGVDEGDSGGPLFIVNDDGSRSQAAVGIRGCIPNRPLSGANDATLAAAQCVSEVCTGGYIDQSGDCTAGAAACDLGFGVPGISVNGGPCMAIVPSLKAYAGQTPCAAAGAGGSIVPGFTRPGAPATCDAVAPMQQCVNGSTIVVGDVCQQVDIPHNYFVEVTENDARSWILQQGADPNRPGRLYGERDYSGTCRTELDASCDRNFDPLADSCPAIFDAGAGFDPELHGGTIKPVIYGTLGVDIHDRVSLENPPGSFGDIASGASAGRSTVVVRNDAKVGNIYGGDLFNFGARSRIGSIYATTCDPIFGDGDDCVIAQPGFNSPVTVGAKLPSVRLTPSFREKNGLPGPTGNGDDYDKQDLYGPNGVFMCNTGSACSFYSGAAVNMAANKYWKDVSVNSGATLRLTAGKHYFDKLNFYSGSKLILDHRQGAVEIYVRDSLFWQGKVEIDRNDRTGKAGATVLGYYGTGTLHLYTYFMGTVVAPRANLELYDQQFTYSGRFVANHVTLRPGVRVAKLLCE